MKSLFDRAQKIIESRNVWETKQRLYYQMRHDGIRRMNKPWAKAADLHFPLIDLAITKAKPFWEGQVTSTDRLASFVAMKAQQPEATSAAADFFDFEIRQRTEFYTEIVRTIDTMLLRMRGVIKATVDPYEDYKIVFESIDPLFILMADGADDFGDADEWVHVQHITVAKYKRNRRYNQDPDVIESIRGGEESLATGEGGYLQDKEAREGINHISDRNKILIYEHWVRTPATWEVHTYCPQAADRVIRKPFLCPYKLNGKASQPFYSFKTEIKDKGWYSSRGLAEKNAPFEQYACKCWNEKTDAMTFGNTPVFTAEGQVQNADNIRWMPGEFIPGNVKQVQLAQPAFSFDQEIAFARSVSEQVSQLPDFGITQPGQSGQPSSPRTATENNRIAQLQTAGTDSNGRIFHNDLAKLYRHVWGLMLQFKRKELTYYTAKELKVMPETAMHANYLIAPDGSPDQWNKQVRFQRAMQRMQGFANNPNVDQSVLTRDALAADDPKLAVEAFIPSDQRAGKEAEDEAMEILILQDGFPAEALANEDHVTRIHTLLSWLEKQSVTGVPMTPQTAMAKKRVQEHLVVHYQYLKATQPQVAAQVGQQIKAAEAQEAQMAKARAAASVRSPMGGPPTPGPGGQTDLAPTTQ